MTAWTALTFWSSRLLMCRFLLSTYSCWSFPACFWRFPSSVDIAPSFSLSCGALIAALTERLLTFPIIKADWAAKPRHALFGFFREVGRGAGAPAGAAERTQGADWAGAFRKRVRADARKEW